MSRFASSPGVSVHAALGGLIKRFQNPHQRIFAFSGDVGDVKPTLQTFDDQLIFRQPMKVQVICRDTHPPIIVGWTM